MKSKLANGIRYYIYCLFTYYKARYDMGRSRVCSSLKYIQ